MILGSDYIVDLEISAAQTEGRGEVISTPRVITANQREASIEQGVEIPYQESASSGATTIYSRKRCSRSRSPRRSRLTIASFSTSTSRKTASARSSSVAPASRFPSIDTREITTSVIVNDGQTVVLGGILETERRETEKKVPYIGDVPGLGRLFKTTGKTEQQRRAADLRHPTNSP